MITGAQSGRTDVAALRWVIILFEQLADFDYCWGLLQSEYIQMTHTQVLCILYSTFKMWPVSNQRNSFVITACFDVAVDEGMSF